MSIHVNNRTVTQIMNGERGVAAKLVYSIKMAVDDLLKHSNVARKKSGRVPVSNMPKRLSKVKTTNKLND